MKTINQLIHSTENIENLKSILKNGLHTSYAKEVFCEENILIPMISFSNILYRDIGSNEVVNYGNYGIVIERELALTKYGLNPVIYVNEDSEVAKSVKYNFDQSKLPLILNYIKDWYSNTNNYCGSFLENVKIKPLNAEMRNLIDSIDSSTSSELLNAYKIIFENIFVNSQKQILLIKPYRVKDKKGKEWIAYNEREWRKSFFQKNFIKEFTLKGEKDLEYMEWHEKAKPHFKEDDFTLKISTEDIIQIIVNTDEDVMEIEDYLKNEDLHIKEGVVSTLQKLKEIELNEN